MSAAVSPVPARSGVGAAADTTVLVKTVKAFIADDADGTNVATVKAAKSVNVEATFTENIVSGTPRFRWRRYGRRWRAVGVIVDKNDVQARIGKAASCRPDGNVRVNAEDDITAVLVAGGGAGGGNTGVGGLIGVATLLGSTKASIGDDAVVNARQPRRDDDLQRRNRILRYQYQANRLPRQENRIAKGLAVTAYNQENLVTTVIGGAGGGTAGVAATVSAGVIATTTEASIGQGARISRNQYGGQRRPAGARQGGR